MQQGGGNTQSILSLAGNGFSKRIPNPAGIQGLEQLLKRKNGSRASVVSYFHKQHTSLKLLVVRDEVHNAQFQGVALRGCDPNAQGTSYIYMYGDLTLMGWKLPSGMEPFRTINR